VRTATLHLTYYLNQIQILPFSRKDKKISQGVNTVNDGRYGCGVMAFYMRILKTMVNLLAGR